LTTVRKVADAGAQPLYALARAPVSSPGIKGQAIAVGVAASIQANTGPCSLFVTQTAASPFTGTFFDIAYDVTLGLFIAVGETGEIQTSTGNGTWTRRSSATVDLYKIATNGLGLCV